MQAAHDRQKSCADLKRKPMEFQVGDRVMIKVSPWKGVVRFGKWGKLNPRYVGPFKEGLHVDDKLCFVEEPVEIMDREVKRLKQSRIPIVKLNFLDPEPSTRSLQSLPYDLLIIGELSLAVGSSLGSHGLPAWQSVAWSVVLSL
ncbi:hypothetical protein Tco_1264125 [Tanacetum coccineum]